MHHVITGGAGFIGSHLARRLLAHNDTVTIVDDLSTGSRVNVPDGAELIERSVIEPMWLLTVGDPDIIWHLASPCSPPDYQSRRLETLQINSNGTAVALGAAAGSGADFVLASTSEIYGDPDVHPQPEDYHGNVNPVGPRSCYDEGKRYAEAMTAAAREENGTTTHIARIFNTYGPGMPDDGRVMIRFITAALKGDPLVVQGTGMNTRSFCYVTDTVDALIALAQSDVDVANVGSDDEININGLAELVVDALNSESDIIHDDPAPEDPRQRRPDLTRIRSLGYEPQVGLYKGIQDTAEAILNG